VAPNGGHVTSPARRRRDRDCARRRYRQLTFIDTVNDGVSGVNGLDGAISSRSHRRNASLRGRQRQRAVAIFACVEHGPADLHRVETDGVGGVNGSSGGRCR
jgi:hypothetical protein